MFRVLLLVLSTLALAISGPTCGSAAIEELVEDVLDTKTVEATFVVSVMDAGNMFVPDIQVKFEIYYPYTSTTPPDLSDSPIESQLVLTGDDGKAAFTYTCPLEPEQAFWIRASAQSPTSFGCATRPNNEIYVQVDYASWTYGEFSLSGTPPAFRSSKTGTLTLEHWYNESRYAVGGYGIDEWPDGGSAWLKTAYTVRLNEDGTCDMLYQNVRISTGSYSLSGSTITIQYEHTDGCKGEYTGTISGCGNSLRMEGTYWDEWSYGCDQIETGKWRAGGYLVVW